MKLYFLKAELRLIGKVIFVEVDDVFMQRFL